MASKWSKNLRKVGMRPQQEKILELVGSCARGNNIKLPSKTEYLKIIGL